MKIITGKNILIYLSSSRGNHRDCKTLKIGMKKISRKNLVLLAAGALLMSMTLILKHYFTINDFLDGLLKGVGIGLMIYSLILVSREQRNRTTECK